MLLTWGFWLAQGVFPLKVIGDLCIVPIGVGVSLAASQAGFPGGAKPAQVARPSVWEIPPGGPWPW